jgi:hypothetical protein
MVQRRSHNFGEELRWRRGWFSHADVIERVPMRRRLPGAATQVHCEPADTDRWWRQLFLSICDGGWFLLDGSSSSAGSLDERMRPSFIVTGKVREGNDWCPAETESRDLRRWLATARARFGFGWRRPQPRGPTWRQKSTRGERVGVLVAVARAWWRKSRIPWGLLHQPRGVRGVC